MNTTSSLRSSSALCVATVVVAGFLCGCTTGARFTVQAERRDGVPVAAPSYRLKPGAGLSASGESPALSAQVQRDVRAALASRGLYAAPEGVVPNLEITVDVGQGPARSKTLRHTAPVYAEGSPPVSRNGELRRDGGSTASMPRKIGEREIVQVVTVHPKYLRLTAHPFPSGPGRRSDESAALWSVSVTNEDESSDLAGYARLMVAAAMDWIGRTTGAPTEVTMSHRDERVVFLAHGTGRPSQVAADAGTPSSARSGIDG